MPAVRAFGFDWAVSSDDFVYTGVAALILRTAWLIASAVVLHQHIDSTRTLTSCSVYEHATIFLACLLTDLSIQCVLQFVVICRSGSGRMNDPKRDAAMSKLIIFQLVMFLEEIILLILGSVWIFSGDSSCDQTVTKTKALIVTGYIWISLCVVRILCNTDPAGCCRSHACGRSDRDGPYRSSERSWESCCSFLCCLADLDNSSRGVILDISRLFFTILSKSGISGRMLVTDFAAAMALIQIRQKREENEHNKMNCIAAGDRPYSGMVGDCDHPCLPLDFNNPEQQEMIEKCRNSEYYFKYALAAYGWPLLLCMRIGTGLCRLAPNCRCCTCCRVHATPNDHCVECNTAAVLCQTGLDRDDLIHVTYHNKPYQPPYFVAVDRVKRSIVIAIRGTMSANDCLTDLAADAVSLGDSDNQLHAHGGIYKAAQYVKAQIEQEQGRSHEQSILQKAFGYAHRVDPNTEYKLVIIGHSLGAGTATILSLLYVLQDRDRYSGLACYAYSPPGGLLSLPAVELTKEFTTSIVIGKDMIPRLSLEKAYQLCHDMKYVVKSTTMKFRAMAKQMMKYWTIALKTRIS
ncbi:diacylglycerol lipase-beta-like isoform X1 [Corticium candelabrum]|uniref:diacylglycerol lipase-beta-like isoform X1 n=1 Tax=Corticium candelabrum TaxID=121492 RepID=UPI002E25F5D0|nr:diacylglycerol lipase-beta-like isoform X1 [Corticium candelabrum]